MPFKAWIVEKATQPGVSVAGLAMSNQVNANQLRRWVKLHGDGLGGMCGMTASKLLPVTIAENIVLQATTTSSAGAPVEIEVAGAIVRVRDEVTPATLRVVLEALRRVTP